ncbi:acyl carrier protein [Thioclava atlantica]|uniref:Phosphopantetheine-binding protein n=1 Tax=Thioclava atlantica TaxID=1317124 RepID=A0A085TZP6_9RHOB|nr:acyl carrier protein [Thioclava atlantica]KFE36193.1 phosphopantetheine-binding protein [Thioclava atlantica]
MTEDDIRRAYIEELVRVAPDIDPATVRGSDHLQDDLELDSMDILNLVIALNSRFGVAISEAEYPRIATPDLAAKFLAEKI